jgi:hypothetical protein
MTLISDYVPVANFGAVTVSYIFNFVDIVPLNQFLDIFVWLLFLYPSSCLHSFRTNKHHRQHFRARKRSNAVSVRRSFAAVRS